MLSGFPVACLKRPIRPVAWANTFGLTALLVSIPLFYGGASSPPPTRPAGRPSLRIVAVGDSITYQGADLSYGWVSDYAQEIDASANASVSVTNLGVDGATSNEIVALVTSDRATRAALRQADIVTYQMGTNDFLLSRGRYLDGSCGGGDNQACLRAMVGTFEANWDQLVTEIDDLAPAAGKRTLTVYYSTVEFDAGRGAAGVLDGYLSQMNTHIKANPGGLVADIYAIYNGTAGGNDPALYLLPDGVHPSELGHRVIYFQLRALGFADVPLARSAEATLVAGARPTAHVTTAHAHSRLFWVLMGATTFATVILAVVGSYMVWRRPGGARS